jgi:hypothetical protein
MCGATVTKTDELVRTLRLIDPVGGIFLLPRMIAAELPRRTFPFPVRTICGVTVTKNNELARTLSLTDPIGGGIFLLPRRTFRSGVNDLRCYRDED